jgi:hypothetical protein
MCRNFTQTYTINERRVPAEKSFTFLFSYKQWYLRKLYYNYHEKNKP